jgi:glycosyltransferase involved in cell wall biosynthesis
VVSAGDAPRLLFLTESFHPVLGGGESHIRELSRRLAAAGFAATVLTRRGDASWPAEEMLEGVRVVRVPPPGPGRTGKYRMVPHALARLRRERGAYDVLVVRGTRVLGLPGLLAARMACRAVVLQAEVNGEMDGEAFTWGTSWARPPWRGLVHAGLRGRNAFFRDADAFVAMSARIRDEFVGSGLPEAKVRWIPHGVDTARFRPATSAERGELRARLGLPPEALLVTYTGRLLRGKGLETLLEAFARLAPGCPEAHLVLVGSGEGQSISVEPGLRARAAEPELKGRVTFAGRVEAVEDWLRASDVFAFPSVFEALGLSLIEASACGLPGVGARTGGIVDVIDDGVTGRLVPPGDGEALFLALQALAEDPRRRVALGAKARERACARFDVRDSVERYAALFRELAARAV